MDAVCLGDFVGTSDTGMNSGVGRSSGCLGGVGEGHVAWAVDNKEEMAMCACAEGAVDRSGIFEYFFFEEGDGCKVGFAFGAAVEGREGAVGEGAKNVAHACWCRVLSGGVG